MRRALITTAVASYAVCATLAQGTQTPSLPYGLALPPTEWQRDTPGSTAPMERVWQAEELATGFAKSGPERSLLERLLWLWQNSPQFRRDTITAQLFAEASARFPAVRTAFKAIRDDIEGRLDQEAIANNHDAFEDWIAANALLDERGRNRDWLNGAVSNPSLRSIALYYAVRLGELGAAERLLTSGADVNAAVGRNRSTPLMQAANRDSLDGIRLLLKAGASVNAQDGSGRSVLQVAMINPTRAEAVTILLDAGYVPTAADVAFGEARVKSYRGRNPKAVSELAIADRVLQRVRSATSPGVAPSATAVEGSSRTSRAIPPGGGQLASRAEGLEPLNLRGTSWFCVMPDPSGTPYEGFLGFHPGGTVKLAEISGGRPNSDRWPSLDPERSYLDVDSVRNFNSPGQPDDRWESTPDEARFYHFYLRTLYRLGLRNGQLVGTLQEADDASYERLRARSAGSLFTVTTKSDWTDQISCTRARGWLQR